MASSLLPDFSRRGPSVVSMRLSEVLLSPSSQKPPGGGRVMATPPMFASAASAFEAAAARTSAAKVRRASMASPVVGNPRGNKTARSRQVNGGLAGAACERPETRRRRSACTAQGEPASSKRVEGGRDNAALFGQAQGKTRMPRHNPAASRHKPPTVACINRAETPLGVDFDKLVRALQKYVDHHLAP